MNSGPADRDVNEEVLFRVLTGSARDTEVEAVTAWRRRAADHEAQYRTLARVLGLAARADRYRQRLTAPRAEEIVARAAIEAERRAGPRPASRGVRNGSHWLRRGVGMAALLTLGFAIARGLPEPAAPAPFGVDEFVTGATEAITVGMRDGTVVRLAPASRLKLIGSAGSRHVALNGRAYFAVARDEQRPFQIRTPAGDVNVLGTRFDLEAESEDLRLIVVEGSVALAAHGEAANVEAGEMARVVKGTALPIVKVPDASALIDWVGGFLVFQETPFDQAAREIGKQYGVTFEVQDTVHAQRTVTAWFTGWTLDEVLDVVCTVVNAECTRQGDVVNVAPRT